MDAYFETSALVPLVIAEAATIRCTEVWRAADRPISSALAYVEMHAALAQAQRQGRLNAPDRHRALDAFEQIWADVVQIPVLQTVVQEAAILAARHSLRGYDAVHCASALAAASDDFVLVSGDREVTRAGTELGLAVIDTTL